MPREFLKDTVRQRLHGEEEFVLYLAPVGKKVGARAPETLGRA